MPQEMSWIDTAKDVVLALFGTGGAAYGGRFLWRRRKPKVGGNGNGKTTQRAVEDLEDKLLKHFQAQADNDTRIVQGLEQMAQMNRDLVHTVEKLSEANAKLALQLAEIKGQLNNRS